MQKILKEMEPGNVCVEMNLCDTSSGEDSVRGKMMEIFGNGTYKHYKHYNNSRNVRSSLKRTLHLKAHECLKFGL